MKARPISCTQQIAENMKITAMLIQPKVPEDENCI